MFEFNAYASYESDRFERAARLQKGVMLEELARLEAHGQRPASAPARLLGLALIRLGRTLQRWGTPRPAGVSPTPAPARALRRPAALCSTHERRSGEKREAAGSR